MHWENTNLIPESSSTCDLMVTPYWFQLFEMIPVLKKGGLAAVSPIETSKIIRAIHLI